MSRKAFSLIMALSPHADPVWHCYAEQYSNFLDRMKLPHFIDYHAKHHPGKSYRDFADDFTAEHFDPAAWADLFRRTGAPCEHAWVYRIEGGSFLTRFSVWFSGSVVSMPLIDRIPQK